MAETAKILNPGKPVWVPDLEAGCSLAEGCPADAFARWLENYPGAAVVSYVNCSAAVKALSDVICTSSNAERVVRSIPEGQRIVFAPDRHLGRYIIRKTGRDMVLWPGTCQVHEVFSEKKIVQLKVRHPEAKVAAHPECDQRVLDAGRPRGLDLEPAQVRAGRPGARVHHRDRAGDHPSDGEGGAGEDVPPGAHRGGLRGVQRPART